MKLTVEQRPDDSSLIAPWSALFEAPGGTVGRSADNQLVLPDPARDICRIQAALRISNDTCYLMNLSSMSSVSINGRPILRDQEVPLSPGDELVIGAYTLRAEDPHAPVATAAGMGAAQVAAAPSGQDPFLSEPDPLLESPLIDPAQATTPARTTPAADTSPRAAVAPDTTAAVTTAAGAATLVTVEPDAAPLPPVDIDRASSKTDTAVANTASSVAGNSASSDADITTSPAADIATSSAADIAASSTADIAASSTADIAASPTADVAASSTTNIATSPTAGIAASPTVDTRADLPTAGTDLSASAIEPAPIGPSDTDLPENPAQAADPWPAAPATTAFNEVAPAAEAFDAPPGQFEAPLLEPALAEAPAAGEPATAPADSDPFSDLFGPGTLPVGSVPDVSAHPFDMESAQTRNPEDPLRQLPRGDANVSGPQRDPLDLLDTQADDALYNVFTDQTPSTLPSHDPLDAHREDPVSETLRPRQEHDNAGWAARDHLREYGGYLRPARVQQPASKPDDADPKTDPPRRS